MKPMQHEHSVELVVPDELKAHATRIKGHFKEYKDLYVVGIGGFALGYFLRKPKTITIVNETTPTFVIMEMPDV